MQALYWDGYQLQFRRDYADPAAGRGLALVRVRLAGICSTDLQLFKGYMAFRGVPGHEFVGEVAEGPPALIGKRVVGEINFACGSCDRCRGGLPRHCPTRRVMGILKADGSFAEYLSIPVANLHVVPEAVADEEAVFTEPLAAACAIVEQLEVLPEQTVVVFGDGKLGLLCAQVLRQTGARVTLIGKHPAKLGLLDGLDIQTSLLADWQPSGADIVVEASGSEGGLALAMQTVRSRGTLVLKSTLAAAHRLSLAPVVINELRLFGSRCGAFGPALAALEGRRVRVGPLLDRVYPLAEGIEAVARAARPGVLKVLLKNA